MASSATSIRSAPLVRSVRTRCCGRLYAPWRRRVLMPACKLCPVSPTYWRRPTTVANDVRSGNEVSCREGRTA